MSSIFPRLAPIVLLICSSAFMTPAWYGHLKFKDRPLWVVILASWGIAFFEYCLAVPANARGRRKWSRPQRWRFRLSPFDCASGGDPGAVRFAECEHVCRELGGL